MEFVNARSRVWLRDRLRKRFAGKSCSAPVILPDGDLNVIYTTFGAGPYVVEIERPVPNREEVFAH